MTFISRRLFTRQSSATLLSGLFVNRSARLKQRPGAQSSSWALTDEFLARLPQLMELASVPGLAIALVQDGKLAWSRGFGVKNAGAKEPVEAETVFEAASLSKPIFAYAVLRMRDDKLIDLDRPLESYLPAPYAADDQRAKQITARHVLSHTTGFPNWRFRKDQKLACDFTPGERFSYSGEGYFYLQRVVEHITGRGFADYMRERVLDPLEMRRSSYVWTADYETQSASGHSNRGQPAEPRTPRFGRKLLEQAAKLNKPLPSWKYEDHERALPLLDAALPVLPVFFTPNAAGSLLTTAPDFARFLTRVMEGPRKGAFDLPEAARREMLAPQVKLNSALSWGLGWGLERADGRDYFWHWGDNPGFKNLTIGDPISRSGIIVLTNGNGGIKVCERIVRQATRRDHAVFLWI